MNESMRRLQSKPARNAVASTAKPKPAHTFVNGFEEATSRKISTQTYERAQRRLEKDVLRNMGVLSRWVVAGLAAGSTS